MTLPDDFREFLSLLNAHDVEFLVLGGHAVSFHGYPRFTHDIDLFVRPLPENARKLIAALTEFGFGTVGLSSSDFTDDATVALGRAPHQIDLMTYIKGVDIEEAWRSRESGKLDGVAVHYISREHLLQNKKSVGRPEDLADIARLTNQS